MRSAAVVFDLDGTLIDSAPDIRRAVNLSLEHFGLPPLPLGDIKRFIGNGVPKFVERVIETTGRDLDFTAFHDRFYGTYSSMQADPSCIFPYVQDILTELKGQGYRLGICTNKSQTATLKVIDNISLRGFFDVVTCGDMLETRKPDPDMFYRCCALLGQTQAVFVGDSEVDAETAKRANAPFILYTEGYRRSPVNTIHHDRSFDDFRQLPELISSLHELPGGA